MDYTGNTDKSKEKRPEKQIEKVVTGEVIQKPKGIGRKFKEIFFGGDFKMTMRSVAADVLFPALRNLIVESISKGAERMVYGDSHRRSRNPEYRSRVQYNNPIYRRDPRDMVHLPDQRPRYLPSRRDANEVILSSMTDAERVVESLADVIDKYEIASVADLNSLLGTPISSIDYKWGWRSLSGVAIRQTGNGYLVDLPPIEEI